MRRRTPNRNGWRGLLRRQRADLYRGGLVYKRPNQSEELIDLYCCRNPFCHARLKTVKAGDPAPVHCGIKSYYIETLPRRRWDQIKIDNIAAIRVLTAKIDAGKIQRQRSAELQSAV